MSRVEVHKFGGTSVGDATRMQQDAAIIARASNAAQIVVVASAMTKVTDALIGAAAAAVDGDRREALQAVAALLNRHEEALKVLAPDGGELAAQVQTDLSSICGELKEMVGAVVLLGELTQRTRDRIISCGEKMS